MAGPQFTLDTVLYCDIYTVCIIKHCLQHLVVRLDLANILWYVLSSSEQLIAEITSVKLSARHGDLSSPLCGS